MNIMLLISIFLLGVAILPLPYLFYNLLRVIVCFTSANGFIELKKTQNNNYAFILLFIAILYNPIFIVHLGKPIWIVTNILTMVYFIYIKRRFYQ